MKGFGAGKGTPPLRKLINDICLKHERLDAINLLLHLYFHHRLVECGGVDPSLICRRWHEVNKIEIPAEAHHRTREGLNWFGVVQRTPELKFSDELVSLFDGSHQRCLRGADPSERLHLLHESAMVFDEDPLASNRTEALFPLYVYDSYIREKSEEAIPVGGLSEHAANALARSGL